MNLATWFGLSDQCAARGMSIHELIALEKPLNPKNLDVYFYLNLIKKNPHLEGFDPIKATIVDFYEAESRANDYNDGFHTLLGHTTLRKYLERWRYEVYKILGDTYIPSKPYFTSGATSTLGKGNNPIQRLATATGTPQVLQYIKDNDLYDSYPFGMVYKEGICIASIVPKTAKVGRLVASPCAINALEQTRIGKAMTKRLKFKADIDFVVAQDLHKHLAKQASIMNHLTTDDQKWASPLVYTALSRYLAPPQWWTAMHATRDHYIEMPDGTIHSLARVATEGNNWCFPWETIVFLGLLRTASHFTGEHVNSDCLRVFGDDLIYPRAITKLVRDIGRNVGFITNVDKSFSDGPFRESCGGDYYLGSDVRPVYLNRSIDHPYDLTIMANQLYALLRKHDFALPIIKRIWLKLIQRIYKLHGRKSALWGPDHLECLHGRPEENWSTRLSADPKSLKEIINTWHQQPKDYIDFRKLVYKQDTSFTMSMICGGYAKGLGYKTIPAQRVSRFFIGPPKPEHVVYQRIPAPGARYKPKKVETQLFYYNNGVDEKNPLSVFDILPNTRCPRRLYDPQFGELEREELLTRLRVSLVNRLLFKQSTVRRLHIDLQ